MPEKPYDHKEVELKWHDRWKDDSEIYSADPESGRPKYYVAEMLPYPSGQLHMGHVRNYSIGDALARYMWMRGYDVLHPMGWDAFGLPAENAALKRGRHPREWTLDNIAEMKRQMKRMGFAYDWNREISTCEPEYYRWNQWFFLKMLERGLAYRKEALLNWCPECGTVLANEQVVDGGCWRHETTPVEQRALVQWFLKITDYAEELLNDTFTTLEGGWPERVLTMQRNWIGRSEGTEADFTLEGTDRKIRVFTTRVDTIFGATCVILAPEHPLVESLIEPELKDALKTMIDARARKDPGDLEKEGLFTGKYAVNPYSGEKVPIWIGNFVLMGYGTGAIMAVPAHDERDFEFCKQYGIAIRPVIRPVDGPLADAATMKEAFAEYGITENTGKWSGLPSALAKKEMNDYAEQQGFGKAAVTYRIKDWGISRQRYWGTPIPVIHCDRCGIVPVPEDQLPVVLPLNVEITGKGRSPLANVPEFLHVSCPECGGDARRETDTMDTFVDSSWYFYRYCDPKNDKAPFDQRHRQSLVPHRPVHRRGDARHSAPDLLPILDQGDARHRPDPERRTRAQPVHSGHGAERRDGDVEIEGQRRGPRRDGGEVRCRHLPAVRVVCRSARTRHGLAGIRGQRPAAVPGACVPLRDAGTSTASTNRPGSRRRAIAGPCANCTRPFANLPPISTAAGISIHRLPR